MGAAGDWCRLRTSNPSGGVRTSPVGSIPTRSRHPGTYVGSSRVKYRVRASVLCLLFLAGGLTAPTAARAQEEAPADTADAGQLAPPTPGAALDTTPSPPVSPLGAFARSLVLPGWGQAEVDEPIRGAVYFAAEAASLWMVFKTQTKLSAAERGAPGDSVTALVESRTGQREDWIVLSAFFALMSGVDAWVSAHLYGFEGKLEPPEDGTPGAQVTYRIPLRLP